MSLTSSCSDRTWSFICSCIAGQAASYSSACSTGSRPCRRSSSSARNSTEPPSMMSVPRPAMLVATVTAPRRPDWATMCASSAWCLAFSTVCGMPRRLSSPDRRLGLLDRHGADQDRLALGVPLGDVVDDRVVLGVHGPVDEVRLVLADHRPVGRDRDHAELVDLVELRGLGHGRTGHAAELLVEPEVVLQRDRREGLVLLADRHALLGLDRLVQPLVVAAAVQHAAGVLVDDEHLALDHDVVAVACGTAPWP